MSLFRDIRDAYRRKEISLDTLRRTVVARVERFARPPAEAVFEDELALIRDDGLRAFTPSVLDRLPNYFWHIPASVVGFHARPEDNELGGLVAHTRRVARMTRVLLDAYDVHAYADDLVVGALLHDGLKYGWTGNDLGGRDHAVFMAEWLERERIFEDRQQIREMIRSHRGRYGPVRPARPLEWALHMADYLVAYGL